ncbi:MAG: alpha/beta fold hydrolase [Aulosira sp. ZfuVER01]|nr:alpha/beta hydrolase [Aulosira sp. ZfuVER01]MDZ7997321.1 alpha/beta hydrolase [Aulosira sp. DedVER01a]MDZ8054154.1 alpha/beta hydrolase [Aulosira sp. ZfuCHP01]
MESKTDKEYQIEIEELQVKGMTFRCRICGLENSGEPVILLHGFPETSQMWEGILIALASQGYRCLAPDQRGYSPGARPKDVKSYRINEIASDIVALADAVGFQKFHLVGHDWGAGCGWTVVQLYPERVNSWAALSIPHMAAFATARRTDTDQKKRSWYINFFQTSIIPETVLGFAASGKRPLLWKFSSDREVADYLTVFKEFNARQATINWYRANKELPIQYGDVFQPSILIWGNQDIAVGRAGVEMTKQYMKGEYSLIELDAGHTLVQEQFARVKDEILNHIQRHPIKN